MLQGVPESPGSPSVAQLMISVGVTLGIAFKAAEIVLRFVLAVQIITTLVGITVGYWCSLNSVNKEEKAGMMSVRYQLVGPKRKVVGGMSGPSRPGVGYVSGQAIPLLTQCYQSLSMYP